MPIRLHRTSSKIINRPQLNNLLLKSTHKPMSILGLLQLNPETIKNPQTTKWTRFNRTAKHLENQLVEYQLILKDHVKTLSTKLSSLNSLAPVSHPDVNGTTTPMQGELSQHLQKSQLELNILERFLKNLKKLPKSYNVPVPYIIQGLNLTLHPEGGFYREFFYTEEKTIIYYMLEPGDTSNWHRLQSTREICRWIAGSSLSFPQINSQGILKGAQQVDASHEYILTAAPNGTFGDWYGAFNNEPQYSFMTCECFPAFKFERFQLATQAQVESFKQKNPLFSDMIQKLNPKNLRQ